MKIRRTRAHPSELDSLRSAVIRADATVKALETKGERGVSIDLARKNAAAVREQLRKAELRELEAWAGPRVCPWCGRVMSNREAAEQGACNDCHGGAAAM